MTTTVPTPRRGRSWIARLLIAALVVAGMSGFAVVASGQQPAHAAYASDFDPGYIISDANFSNQNAMNAAQVQYFLDGMVPTCKASAGGPPCLRNYSETTSTKPAVAGRCDQYNGGTQTAAQIIDGVARACGISQEVLLVLLQKEQNLVTSVAPTSSMYLHATGYACPDTAPCDTAYYGFSNQVYNAALQFKRYQGSPTSWSYQAGRVNTILYSPNAACGTKSVFIQNQATASLYVYTPYTPNQAALDNLYGTGDSCSAYGNRNFWRIYSDWFGSPTGGNSPYGSLTAVNAGLGQATVTGWAVDPDTRDPIRVDLYVDGKGAASTTANIADPTLATTLGSTNTTHAFTATLSGLSAGTHQVCAWAINVGDGQNNQFACRSFTIQTGSPMLNIDQAAAQSPGTMIVRGWAIDPDTADPVRIDVYVDGRGVTSTTANTAKASLATAFPGYGANHQFAVNLTGVSAGTHQVCTAAVNVAGGGGATWWCGTIAQPTGSPMLNIDQASSTALGSITMRGWAIDPDTTSSVRIDTYVDGRGWASLQASDAKASLATAFPGYGANHQYSETLTGLSPGTHQVCTFAINVGGGGNTVDCRNVTMTTGSPALLIDEASSPTAGTVLVRGWAIDPDTTAPVRVDTYVDGVGASSVQADQYKGSLATTYGGYGGNHQFSTTIPGVAAGTHQVCTFAIDVGTGGNTVACNTVTVG